MNIDSNKLRVIIVSVILAIGLLVVWHELKPFGPAADRAPIIGLNTGIGQVLAEQTVKAVSDHGLIVLVTDFDHDNSNGRKDERWDTFLQEIKKHPGIKMDGVEVIEHDPREDQSPGLPSTAYEGLLQRHPKADAFVFFIDLPEWAKVGVFLTQPVSYKLVATDNMGIPSRRHYAGYFNNGVLFALIGTSPQAPASQPSNLKTPQEWFEKYRTVYTAANQDLMTE